MLNMNADINKTFIINIKLLVKSTINIIVIK